MYHDRPFPRRAARALRAAAVFLAAALLLTGALWANGRVRADMDSQAASSVRRAVLDAAVQCYAVEGVYPSDLAYLEENYGLQINHRAFIVTYEAFASNLLPDVAVLQK